MSAFMINTSFGKSLVEDSRKLNDRHDGVITIRDNHDDFRVASGDNFCSLTEEDTSRGNVDNILLQLKGTAWKVHTNEDKNLTDSELIQNRELQDAGKKPLKYYKHFIEFKNAREFYKHNKLDDYSYSLVRVYKRYNVPARHFSRTVTSLHFKDYETLKKERIYYQRTIFGRLINALPYENRLQFVMSCIEKFNTTRFHLIDLAEGLEYLKSFVDGGLLQLGHILVDSDDLAMNLPFLKDEIGFVEPELLRKKVNPKKPDEYLQHVDFLSIQALRFQKLFNEHDDFFKLFSLDGFEINNAETVYFKKLFKGSNWPIDLTQDRYE